MCSRNVARGYASSVAGNAMKALGVLGSLILTALSSDMLQRSSGDTESHSGSAVETYRERYLTPVVLTGIAAFCVLQIYLLVTNVRKQLSKRRTRRARARFQQVVRKVVNINRIRAKRRTRHGLSNLEPTAPLTCSAEAASSFDPDATALNVSPEADLSDPCRGASHRSEDAEAQVPVPSPGYPSSQREPLERSAEPGIECGDSDRGDSASIASIPQTADSTSGNTVSIALPPTVVSARAELSPQEVREAFVKLGVEWCDPDAGSTEPIASITLTCVATSGDDAFGVAHQPTGPAERIHRRVLNSDFNRFARLGIDGAAGASSSACTSPGLPSMSWFSAADSFDQLGCTADMQSDQASEHSASDATSVTRPRSRSQLIASPSEGSNLQAGVCLEPCPEAASLSPAFFSDSKRDSPRCSITRASAAADARPRARVNVLPAATAACSDLAALSSGRAAPDSRAVCGLANDTRIERDFDSANGSQSEAAFDSANSSPSNSEAIAGASVESYVKSRAAAVNLNSMSGAADSIRRSHCPKEHEAPQLELEADADSCDTRYKWI